MAIKLNEINMENIGDWPVYIRAGCCVIVFGLITFFGYWFFIGNSLSQIDRLKQQEGQLKQKIKIRIDHTVNLKDYIQQMNKLTARFDSLLNQLPGEKEIPKLLENITTVGLKSGLVFNLIRPSGGEVTDFYETIPIEIEVEGTYNQLGEFVEGIEKLSRIVIITDFSVNTLNEYKDQTADKKLVMNVSAETYRYLTEQEQERYKRAQKRLRDRKR